MSMDVDLVLPYGIRPSSQTWGIDNQVQKFGLNKVQRVSRGVSRWRCTMQFNNITGDERRAMQSFLADAEGGAKTFGVRYFGEPANTSSAEEVSAPGELTDSAVWIPGSVTANRDNYRTRLLTTSGVSRGRVSQTVNLFDNARYCVDVCGMDGTVPAEFAIGTSVGADDVVSKQTLANRYVAQFQTPAGPESSDFYLDVFAEAGAVDKYAFIEYASISRCAAVNGASQTGTVLLIKGLPAEKLTARGGEMIEVNGELKMLTHDVRTFAGSSTTEARFFPPLRESPPDNGYVKFLEPMARMILDEDKQSWSESVYAVSVDGHAVSNFVLSCIEALD